MLKNDQLEYNYYHNVFKPLLAGATAGLAVDITLYPIDTIKTRLQSPHGFLKSGGFARIYLGIGSTISGSAPGAALFFFTYESMKSLTSQYGLQDYHTIRYMISASAGETVACLVRVPVEVVKQRAQAYNTTSILILRETLARFGFLGLYRGYSSTIIREIPFSFIQFPLWEYLKQLWCEKQQQPIQPYQAMICGSISGGVAAFITTPLDVAKTQIMLKDFRDSRNENYLNKPIKVNYSATIRNVYQSRGFRGLFAGALPRVIWISVGGAIFLGGYTKITTLLS